MTMDLKRSAAAFVCGLVFATGLAVSGLANPDKVLQFLTLNSNWSPALLFTMLAGIFVTFAGYRWVLNRGPIFSDTLHLPTRTDIDRRLLAGAGIFGVGWGLAGFCPGPALTALSSMHVEPFIFVAAMIAGSLVEAQVTKDS